jgi:hypothetical protein
MELQHRDSHSGWLDSLARKLGLEEGYLRWLPMYM